MANRLDWRGDEVMDELVKNLMQAVGEFGLVVEGEAKKELFRGHGVETGTLRRSIHAAEPGYRWNNDDTKPSADSPERGGEQVEARKVGANITVEVGSGLIYALAVHQGHQGFEGYHYLTNGLEKSRDKLGAILEKYKVKP